MLKPEQVPKEVVWKLQDKILSGSMSIDECARAFAAALNAWPGGHMLTMVPQIILPLTENPDAEA